MKYQGKMSVSSELAAKLTGYEQSPDPNLEAESTLFDRGYVFPNGMRMGIQVIAASDPSENGPWTQGVLFSEDGHELNTNDGGEQFLGEYSVPYKGDEYVVEVVVQEPLRVEKALTARQLYEHVDEDNLANLLIAWGFDDIACSSDDGTLDGLNNLVDDLTPTPLSDISYSPKKILPNDEILVLVTGSVEDWVYDGGPGDVDVATA